MPRVVLVTGLQAAGKSIVGPLLAARLGPPAVSFDGDVLFTGVVSGRAEMTAEPSVVALRQLQLRYGGSALLAQQYADAGFDFVCHDIILGSYVEDWMSRLERVDRHLVVFNPSYDVLAERELGRGGQDSYRDWQYDGDSLVDAIARLGKGLDETPRRGLWLDTTHLSPQEAVEQILIDDLASSRW